MPVCLVKSGKGPGDPRKRDAAVHHYIVSDILIVIESDELVSGDLGIDAQRNNSKTECDKPISRAEHSAVLACLRWCCLVRHGELQQELYDSSGNNKYSNSGFCRASREGNNSEQTAPVLHGKYARRIYPHVYLAIPTGGLNVRLALGMFMPDFASRFVPADRNAIGCYRKPEDYSSVQAQIFTRSLHPPAR
jgi:hypothetical protein